MIQTLLLWSANQVVLLLTGLHLNKKSREVCMKARIPPALVAFIGQVNEDKYQNHHFYSPPKIMETLLMVDVLKPEKSFNGKNVVSFSVTLAIHKGQR